MTANGMTANGMTANGMTANGMTANGADTGAVVTNGLPKSDPNWNGLSESGLTTKALTNRAFSSWFTAVGASYADMVMRYVAKCALSSAQSLTYTDATGAAYTWPGNLGLAPAWASGKAIPANEQQLVSACLAAHANKYGLHIALSIRGQMSDGTFLAVDSAENATYTAFEACFFGNLFDGSGVFAAADKSFGSTGITSPRACAIDPNGVSQCPPMVVLPGGCTKYCSGIGGSDPSIHGTYTSCSWNGVTYAPVNTHLLPSDVYKCGDGVCQFTESCYDATTKTGCSQDCGSCQ
jgi:hypothetical protein